MNDDDPVGGRMDVELDGVSAALERAPERRKRIFRQFALGSAMSNALHSRSFAHVSSL
jgi:hypothetical protein